MNDVLPTRGRNNLTLRWVDPGADPGGNRGDTHTTFSFELVLFAPFAANHPRMRSCDVVFSNQTLTIGSKSQAVLSLELTPEAVGGHVTALSQLTEVGADKEGWARRVLKACEALMGEFVTHGGAGPPSDRRVISALFTVGKVHV